MFFDCAFPRPALGEEGQRASGIFLLGLFFMVDREVQLLERFHSLVVCLSLVAQELMLVVENLYIAFCFGSFCAVSAVPVKRLLREELRKELCSDAAFNFLASVKLRGAF